MSREEEADARVEVSVDEAMARVLDQMLLYLRIVHSLDYYSLAEYSTEDEMPNRCGILHVRDGLMGDSQQAGCRSHSIFQIRIEHMRFRFYGSKY